MERTLLRSLHNKLLYSPRGFMKVATIVTLILISFSSLANSSLPNNRHIVIEGKAEITAIPDIAIISFEVSKQSPTSLKAKKEIDKVINTFLEGVSQFGISETDISASSISTEQDYKYVNNEPVANGFSASRDIEVTLKNINQLSSFIDFALENKVNILHRITLASSKSEELEVQVNKQAILNAKEKAKSLAEAFGARLGDIYSINTLSENSNHGYGIEAIVVENFNGSRATMNKPGKFLQERITFSASIHVVFDLDVK